MATTYAARRDDHVPANSIIEENGSPTQTRRDDPAAAHSIIESDTDHAPARRDDTPPVPDTSWRLP